LTSAGSQRSSSCSSCTSTVTCSPSRAMHSCCRLGTACGLRCRCGCGRCRTVCLGCGGCCDAAGCCGCWCCVPASSSEPHASSGSAAAAGAARARCGDPASSAQRTRVMACACVIGPPAWRHSCVSPLVCPGRKRGTQHLLLAMQASTHQQVAHATARRSTEITSRVTGARGAMLLPLVEREGRCRSRTPQCHVKHTPSPLFTTTHFTARRPST
jgi:hypothetical protein